MCHVVLVDEEVEITRVWSYALKVYLPVKVSAFNKAEEALSALSEIEGEISLVVSDLRMPGMGGLAFIRALREKGHKMPILVASGLITDEVKQQGHTLDITTWIHKPFGINTLLRHIRAALSEYDLATGIAEPCTTRL